MSLRSLVCQEREVSARAKEAHELNTDNELGQITQHTTKYGTEREEPAASSTTRRRMYDTAPYSSPQSLLPFSLRAGGADPKYWT